MRIGVLGAGSIGTLFGTLLYRSGNEVVLYNRNRTIVAAIRKNGVKLTETNGQRITVKVPIELPPRTLGNHDLVLITVKAYDTLGVAKAYARKVGDADVLTLQNGLGNYELLSRFIGRDSVFVGSTSEAALTLQPGKIAHTGTGNTWVGEYEGHRSNRSHRIAKSIRDSGLSAQETGNMRGVLWGKAIINSAINPVTALTRLRNGRVAKIPQLVYLMDRAVSEGVKVSRAKGAILEPSFPETAMRKILRATANNKSSMLQDVERARPTEIEQLNGVIVKAARKVGVAVPTNEFLLEMVRALETSYLANKRN